MTPRQKEALRRLARRNFGAFVQYSFPDYNWNWHSRLLVDKLQRWHDGEIPRLMVSVEPRAGKSELVSRRLPAYAFGVDPSTQIISVTYGQTLSTRLSKETQRILRSESYKEVFPEVHLDAAQASSFETSEGGVYLATSIGGSMTGFGANKLIIDDPFRSREDAESETIRRKTYDSFLNDAMTRLIHPASVLLTNTRWHMRDLQGTILSQPGAEDWEVINIPAIAEEPLASWDPRQVGDPIWPERYVGFDPEVPYELACEVALEEYRKIRERDPYLFSSLHQGNPTPREGGLFKRVWFERTYAAKPETRAAQCDEILISVDAAFAKGRKTDPVELLVLGRSGRYIYLLDEVNRRMDFPSTLQAIRELRDRWPKAALLIETKANGQALIDTLRQNVRSVIEFHPGNTNKEARAHSAAHRLQAGDIICPLPVHAPWIAEFCEEFAGFGTRPHDDRVDALSQACIHWNERMDRADKMGKANDGLKGLLNRISKERAYGRL